MGRVAWQDDFVGLPGADLILLRSNRDYHYECIISHQDEFLVLELNSTSRAFIFAPEQATQFAEVLHAQLA